MFFLFPERVLVETQNEQVLTDENVNDDVFTPKNTIHQDTKGFPLN